MTEELLDQNETADLTEVVYSSEVAEALLPKMADKLTQDVRNLEKSAQEQNKALRSLERTATETNNRLLRIETLLTAPKGEWHKHPIVVVVVGFLLTGFLAFQAWLGVTTHTNSGEIAKIEQALIGLGVSVAATNPSSPSSQDEARAALKEAKEKSVPLSARTVAEGGKAFIEASAWAPSAWPVALDFVQYRSFLNLKATPQFPPRRTDGGVGAWPMEIPGPQLVIGFLGRTDLASSARSERIDSPRDYSVPYPPPAFITFSRNSNDAPVNLDGLRLRHVIFTGLKIVYHGGPLEMNDVWFVDCVFEIEQGDRSYALVSKIVEPGPTSFQAGL